MASSKVSSQCADELIGLGRAWFNPGFPTTSGLPGFHILTTHNLLNDTFDNSKIYLEGDSDIDGDLSPVFI